MKKPFLEAGEIVTTHGIAGELRLYPWCDGPEFLTRFKTLYFTSSGGGAKKVVSARPHKNLCLVKLEGVTSIAEARPYIGKTVYIARQEAALEDGRFFVQDLIGAKVVDANTGQEYGIVKGVTHPGKHDVYEVERPGGEITLFPATPPFLGEIDLEQGRVEISPIEGMFDEDDSLTVKPGKKKTKQAAKGKASEETR